MKVLLSRQAEKFLKKAQKQDAQRILEEVLSLEQDPYPRNAKRLKGDTDYLRLRIGDYRALYVVREKTIRVDRIDKRDRVYKR